MVRIIGVDLVDKKRIDFALTKLYGIGWSNVQMILKSAKVDSSKRTNELAEEEIGRIQKVVEKYKVEGDLRREVQENIKRLKEIGTYRGLRHSRNLPVRGQRTRSNARTKRGKRVTIGAIKKEVTAREGAPTSSASGPVAAKTAEASKEPAKEK
jgi:small subunit ribosomal protein S13